LAYSAKEQKQDPAPAQERKKMPIFARVGLRAQELWKVGEDMSEIVLNSLPRAKK